MTVSTKYDNPSESVAIGEISGKIDIDNTRTRRDQRKNKEKTRKSQN
jgi:hypothetical protein